VAGSADITTLYTARYGVPPVGKKVYVRVNQFVDGWEDLPVTFSAKAIMRTAAISGLALFARGLLFAAC
jgi:hypothetical protein